MYGHAFNQLAAAFAVVAVTAVATIVVVTADCTVNVVGFCGRCTIEHRKEEVVTTVGKHT